MSAEEDAKAALLNFAAGFVTKALADAAAEWEARVGPHRTAYDEALAKAQQGDPAALDSLPALSKAYLAAAMEARATMMGN